MLLNRTFSKWSLISEVHGADVKIGEMYGLDVGCDVWIVLRN